MKLKTLAIAIAVGALPFAAQADYKISGDIGAKYDSGTESITEQGTEINLDASQSVRGVTYFGHAEIETGGNLDELYVGAKGGFGEIRLGDTDNACDALDVGGTNDWLGRTHDQGACAGDDDSNLVYTRSMGRATVAVSANPNDGNKNFAVGVKGALGPITASLGYEDIDSFSTTGADTYSCAGTASPVTDTNGTVVCTDGSALTTTAGVTTVTAATSNVTLGLSGKLGPVSVGFQANKMDGQDAVHGVNFMYSAGANNFYGGLGTSDNNDTMSIGYQRNIGKTDVGFEWNDDGTDDGYAIGMRHKF